MIRLPRTRRIPQRTCVGCGAKKAKKQLLRIVRTPDGEIDIDPGGKKSGRGVYICPDTACLEKAMKAKRLEKALEHEIPEDIVEKLRQKITLINSESPVGVDG